MGWIIGFVSAVFSYAYLSGEASKIYLYVADDMRDRSQTNVCANDI